MGGAVGSRIMRVRVCLGVCARDVRASSCVRVVTFGVAGMIHAL